MQVTYLVWTNLGHDRERLIVSIQTTPVLIRFELGERYALMAQQVRMNVVFDALVELSATFARRLVPLMHVLASLLTCVHSDRSSLASFTTSLPNEDLGRLSELLRLLLSLRIFALLLFILSLLLILAQDAAEPGGIPHLSTLLSYDRLEQFLLHS